MFDQLKKSLDAVIINWDGKYNLSADRCNEPN